MTNETPKIVTSSRRREAPVSRAFPFTQNQVRVDGLPDEIKAYRVAAWEAYQALAMPTTRDEPWRRTDLAGLKANSFRLAEKDAYLDLAPLPEGLMKPIADRDHGGEVVLTPGGARVDLAPDLVRQGVIFTDLRTAEKEHPEILARVMGNAIKPKEGKFAALAAAFADTGALLYVPRGVQIDQPLHSLLWGPGVGLAHISHLMVWMEEGSSVTYVHEYASPTEVGQTLHCGLVEVHVGAGANLNFVELQSWGENVWNFTHERVQVEQDGNVDWVFGAIGGHLTKNFADLNLVGRGSSGRMSGFYFTDGKQHLDYDSQQNHLSPNTTSDLLFKGALIDSSRVVWQGMIYVAPGAMKTDGYQANRNLVLSRDARAEFDPRPGDFGR